MEERNEALFLVFAVDGRRFALPVEVIERVVAAVETTPLPNSPSFLRGVVNCAGDLVPIIDLRVRFGLPARMIRASDRLIFIKYAASETPEVFSLYSFLVESVEGVFPLEAGRITLPESSLRPGDVTFEGTMVGRERGDDRIVCIQTVEALFAMTDAEMRAIEQMRRSSEEAVS